MQSGHSFLPNDADFGIIEKAKKTASNVYIPDHWREVIAKARKRNPFKVVNMQSGDFVDLTKMSKTLCNRKKDKDGYKVSWLNTQSIRFTPEQSKLMHIQYVCDPQASWTTVDLSRSCMSDIELTYIPSEPRKLNVNKIKDLHSLKPFIPPAYHDFYDQLQSDSSTNNDMLPDEDAMLDSSECESEMGDATESNVITMSRKRSKLINNRRKKSDKERKKLTNENSRRGVHNAVTAQLKTNANADHIYRQPLSNMSYVDNCVVASLSPSQEDIGFITMSTPLMDHNSERALLNVSSIEKISVTSSSTIVGNGVQTRSKSAMTSANVNVSQMQQDFYTKTPLSISGKKKWQREAKLDKSMLTSPSVNDMRPLLTTSKRQRSMLDKSTVKAAPVITNKRQKLNSIMTKASTLGSKRLMQDHLCDVNTQMI